MDENRRKVLEMLAQGKLTVEQAERLFEKLADAEPAAEAGETSASRGKSTAGPADNGTGRSERKAAPRSLRVKVDTEDGDKVNVRVPMAMLRTGVKLGALLPKYARQAVEAQGVDLAGLSNLEPDEIAQTLADLSVDICDEDGNSVQIFCE